MKIFRNPWAAGGVAVLAVAVVFYTVDPLRMRRGQGNRGPQPSAAAAASKGATSVEAPPPKTVPPPGMAIDRNYAQTHFPGWIEAPPRDPFQMIGVPVMLASGPTTPSPVLSWKLSAIWRQSGGSLAAINHAIFREGDQIQGYKIQRIEGDRVWFEGPAGQESLDFEKHDMVVITSSRGPNAVERFLGPEQADLHIPKQ